MGRARLLISGRTTRRLWAARVASLPRPVPIQCVGSAPGSGARATSHECSAGGPRKTVSSGDLSAVGSWGRTQKEGLLHRSAGTATFPGTLPGQAVRRRCESVDSSPASSNKTTDARRALELFPDPRTAGTDHACRREPSAAAHRLRNEPGEPRPRRSRKIRVVVDTARSANLRRPSASGGCLARHPPH